MYFETYIADDSRKKLFDILGYPDSNSTAFSVMFELINRKTGEWKDKEILGVSTSGCVRVSKKDILYFIDKCCKKGDFSNKSKWNKEVMELDDKKDYWIFVDEG